MADKLDTLLDFVEVLAAATIRQRGELAPCVVCEMPDGVTRVALGCQAEPGQENERTVATRIGGEMRARGVARYCHASAAPAAAGAQDAQSPHRDEMVMLEAHEIARSAYRRLRVDRGGERPVLTRLEDEGNLARLHTGPWKGLLRPHRASR